MLTKVGSILNIRPGEGQLMSLFALHSFFVGVAQVLVSTTASTLFLDSFGDQTTEFLPYVYIGSAIAASTTGFIFTRVESRFSFGRLLSANLTVLIIALVGFRILFSMGPQAQPIALGLYIWYYVQDALINLEFWALAGRTFDVRQGKRLFGLVGAGEMVARTVTGFSVRPLVQFIDPVNLLVIAAGAIALNLVLLIVILNKFDLSGDESEMSQKAAISSVKALDASAPKQDAFVTLLKSRYTQLMMVLAVLALVAYYFVDIAYLEQARLRYPDKADLAAFIGEFFALIGLMALLSRLFLTGRLISRYGLQAGLLALPIAVSVGVIAMTVVGSIPAMAAFLFFPAVGTKFLFIVFRKSTDKSATRILYQPLPERKRLTAQTIIESIVEPMASGIAGVLLLVLSLDTLGISYSLLFILAGWIAVIIFLNREYTSTLIKALSERRLHGLSMDLSNEAYRHLFEQSLESKHAGEVIYALNIIEEAQPSAVQDAVNKLLRHPSPVVRADILDRIERLQLNFALKRVQSRLRLETDPKVLGAVVRTTAALGETEVLDEIIPYLEHPQPVVQKGAMVGLLRSGGVEGVLAAGEILLNLVKDPEPLRRQFAAEVLGEVGIKNFYRPLLTLLTDSDWAVRREAIYAAGKLNNPRLWPALIDNLSHSQVRSAATSALVASGPEVVVRIEQAFNDPEQSNRVRLQLARACGRIRAAESVAFLRQHLHFPDEAIRTQIFRSLSLNRYQADETDQEIIINQVEAEVKDAAWTLAVWADLQEIPIRRPAQRTVNGVPHGHRLLISALEYEFTLNRERIFLLLSFIYDTDAILQARSIIENKKSTSNRVAYALEVMDTLMAQSLKPLVLPLMEDISTTERKQRLQNVMPLESFSPVERLRQLIDIEEAHVNDWTQTGVLYDVWLYKRGSFDVAELTASALHSPHALVRESAIWVLHQLKIDSVRPQIEVLTQDPDPRVVQMAIHYLASNSENTQPKGGIMLSTLEMVLILKAVDMFSETPDDVLAEIAGIMDLVEAPAGEAIFKQGEIGTSLYIVLTGRVRIHTGEQTLTELGPREVFGELTILDTEPRSATATALEDSRLLRLEQQPFYAVMENEIQVATGVIKVLSRRLRRQNEALSLDSTVLPKPKTRTRSDIEGILDKLD